MQPLNEAGQILLPLTKVSKEIIYELCHLTEVGLKFNNVVAEKWCLFILTSRSIEVENYLNKVAKIKKQEDIGLLKRLYTIEVSEEYKMDWRSIIRGKYSLVNKVVVNKVILPNLRGNKRDWKRIFDKDEMALRSLLERKLNRYKGQKLTDAVNATIKEMKQLDVSVELKPAINHNENTIIYEYKN